MLDFQINYSVFSSLFGGYLVFLVFVFGTARAINLLSEKK